MRALEELDCGVAKASETEETRSKTKANAERVFMVPPLPHARESKGWPAQRQNVTRAADFAGILAWRQIGAPEFSGNAPATFPPRCPEERNAAVDASK